MTNDRLARNNAYYDRFAREVGDRTEARNYSRALVAFIALLRPEATVLDMGCGAGHHMLALRDLGYAVIGVDPSPRMRALAAAKGLPVVDGSFDTLPDLELPEIHGVWCAATLLHVPEDELMDALLAVRARLPEDGPFFFTVRLGSGAGWDAWDDAQGDAERFIQLFAEPQLLTALEAGSFRIVEQWTEASTWGRPSEWISIVATAR